MKDATHTIGSKKNIKIVGLISDTHGLLREEAIEALRGTDLIIHAGDVGAPEILDRLREIAPVVAVCGNVDVESWADVLPRAAVAAAGAVLIYVLHDVNELDLDPAAAGFQIVISGHSHKPVQEERRGVLYINPGSAGPRRFSLPITVARMDLSAADPAKWKIEFVNLTKSGIPESSHPPHKHRKPGPAKN